ncbi:DUF934 domain-containing protein [Nitrospirillum iridis]|uniref:Uncharacterized protein (DUF934 family) n=1 Tax=Nitrospirillum iridis TaxID=765888 RepID=A0A7X0ECD4_9PROT|nr:DUF934 domain-containing protein [Nitrospirillum iridis]MBB6251592.1 uncharacterized protein (DUF934 family) [Nitrospirillum iridis]
MPLIESGKLIDDAWVRLGDDEALPASDVPVIVSLARFHKDRESLVGRNGGLGVFLASNQHPKDIADHLADFALVALDFPKFRDGRGFTVARELREYLGYRGTIRAVGHTIPDQYLFLVRCGVDQVEIAEGKDAGLWAHALTEIDVAYQVSVAGPLSTARLARHASTTGGVSARTETAA